MAETKRKLVEFKDWKFGSSGDRTEQDSPPNSFKGENVLAFSSGAVGPRPGLTDCTPTGMPAGHVRALGHRPALGINRPSWFVVGVTVYSFDDTGVNAGVSTYTGSLAGAPAEHAHAPSSVTNATYFTIPGDKTYYIDHLAQTVTALAGSPGGTAVCEHMRFVCVAVGNRLHFSARDDRTVWPPTNYIDIGDTYAVTGLLPLRDRLMVAKLGGSWHSLTGVLDEFADDGVTERTIVESVDPGLFRVAPGAQHKMCRDTKGLIQSSPAGIVCPATFDGVAATIDRHHSYGLVDWGFTDGVPGIGVATSGLAAAGTLYLSGPGSVGVSVRDTGAARHAFDVPVSGLMTVGAGNSNMLISDGGGAATAGKFYRFRMMTEAANNTGADFAIGRFTFATRDGASATPFDAWFETARHDVVGGEALLRRCVVYFQVADITTPIVAPSADTVHFDVSIIAKHIFEGDKILSATQNFDDLPANYSNAGEYLRKEFGFGDQGLGGAFTVKFANIRGVTIERVVVEYDVIPMR